jgi:hypothetical protein
MPLTHHASTRLQQRGIPPLMVDLLARYGREQPARDGTVLFLDVRGRQRVREALTDTLARFDKFADTYLVEAADTGAVVTVGHHTRRLRRR